MSYEDLYQLNPPQRDLPYIERFTSRAEGLARLGRGTPFDVVVVGGGIHGATFARLSALNGLRTALFEMGDYASATSSRSSKMAHGGLRYLEMFDFRQVFEGIKAREDLFETTHLVTPEDFLIPIFASDRLLKWKLHVGLRLYDWFVRSKERRHRWIPRSDLSFEAFHRSMPGLIGCFRYVDGLLDDTRLVIENIVAARQEGAACFNYARVDSLRHESDDRVTVGVTDVLTERRYEIRTGIVVNCAGPWAPMVGRVSAASSPVQVRYSRGVHLLFDRPWRDPSLFLPMGEKGRYYFVWPHPAGTMVGTTEREVGRAEWDPMPSAEEVDEVLVRLARDIPHAGLDRNRLHYAFAGLRTLPVRSGSGSTSALSRKHIWHYGSGMLSLFGGKYTTASWTSYEGLKRVFQLAGLSTVPVSLEGRLLPGAALRSEIPRFEAKAGACELSPELVQGAVHRLGGRVGYLLEEEDGLTPIGDVALKGELAIAVRVEQAETLEDILRRRLGVEYLAGHGLGSMDSLLPVCASLLPDRNLETELDAYKKRLAALMAVMKPPSAGEPATL